MDLTEHVAPDEARSVADGDVVVARVGESLHLRVARPGARAVHGGPPGMYLRRDGVVDYDLGPDAVGRWEIRVGDAVAPRWFVLEVEGPGGAPDDPVAETVGRARSGLTVGCGLSLGAALSAQSAPVGASAWETLGPAAARRTASPTALGACTTNTPIAPVFGLEVAPFAVIREETAPLTYWAGIQARVGDVAAGPYATRNHWGYGVGGRATLRTGRWGGPELRLDWVPPQGAPARGTGGLYRNEDALTAGLAWTLEGWL